MVAQDVADAGVPVSQRPTTLESAEVPLSMVEEYQLQPNAYRDRAWWKRLETELSLENTPHDAVTADQFRHIILFKNIEGDKLDLSSSVDVAYDAYRFHSNDGIRMLALLSLHAIGDRQSIVRVQKNLHYEKNERIRRMAIAAISEFYAEQ